MALTDARSYLRDRLEALGYEEWRDGFNIENIPSTRLSDAFHIESGSVDSAASSHQPHSFNCNFTLRVWLNGYLDLAEAIDDAYEKAEAIYAEILLPANRLSSTIQDVVPNSFSVTPLAESNDNTVQLEFSFLLKTFINF